MIQLQTELTEEWNEAGDARCRTLKVSPLFVTDRWLIIVQDLDGDITVDAGQTLFETDKVSTSLEKALAYSMALQHAIAKGNTWEKEYYEMDDQKFSSVDK